MVRTSALSSVEEKRMTEKVKKATTPTTPRKTPAKKSAAVAKPTTAKVSQEKVSHEEITKLAHQLWLERGQPLGEPEADWQKAEQLLRAKKS